MINHLTVPLVSLFAITCWRKTARYRNTSPMQVKQKGQSRVDPSHHDQSSLDLRCHYQYNWERTRYIHSDTLCDYHRIGTLNRGRNVCQKLKVWDRNYSFHEMSAYYYYYYYYWKITKPSTLGKMYRWYHQHMHAVIVKYNFITENEHINKKKYCHCILTKAFFSLYTIEPSTRWSLLV